MGGGIDRPIDRHTDGQADELIDTREDRQTYNTDRQIDKFALYMFVLFIY